MKAAFARFQMPVLPMASADYDAFARRTVEAERATLARLNLLQR